jgi:hypothetical protein
MCHDSSTILSQRHSTRTQMKKRKKRRKRKGGRERRGER